MKRKISTKSRSEYLNKLFEFLTQENISYCVVGDSEELPDNISSDIDIVVSNKTLSIIKNKIFEFSNKNNCSLVQILQHECNAYYFVLSWFNHEAKVNFLHPDICSDYYRNGKPFLLASDLLNDRQLAVSSEGIEKTFYVPAAELEFIYYLIKKVDKGIINQNQYKHLRDQYSQATDKCHNWLHKYWLLKDVDKIIQLMSNEDVSELRASLSYLQIGLINTRKSSIIDHLNEFRRKIKRVFQPTGIVIALLGPDGVGKTAIGDQLQLELSPAFRKLKRFHLRPGIIGKKKKGGVPVSDPHEKPARGLVASIVKLIYFFTDYSLGYYFKVRPYKVRSTFVIFDRYFHDLLIDPRRYRYGAPMWMATVVARLIPRPDMFVILDASAEIIHERKQEVTLEETNRQRKEYLNFAASNKNCVILNTSSELDETVSDGCTAILDFMKKRQKTRMNIK